MLVARPLSALSAGYVQKDYYLGFTAGVDAIAAAQPAASQSCLIKLWELNEGDEFENYAAKISGYFVATETGPHVYRVELFGNGGNDTIGDSSPATSIFLSIDPNDELLNLSWQSIRPKPPRRMMSTSPTSATLEAFARWLNMDSPKNTPPRATP